MYASGVIINGFTPSSSNKRDVQSLCHAIKQFKVSVVIVIDREELEKVLTTGLQGY